ncbi:MAG TPA: hypothetical protein VGQ73_05290, partial [Gemmatimonadales bacterium]|nr:hypothetical protein [Gemmatimonadales bacterium]
MDLRRFALPSPADAVFILFLLSVTLVRGHQAINTDGDLGRHIRVGETILAEGGLFYTDRFSHTMAGQPFVPYEWLSEVLFAAAHRLGGLAGTLVLTGIVVAAAYALVVLFLQRSGVDPLAAVATAIVAGLLGAVHWLARPHVFTLLGAVVTLWLLERGGRRAPLAVVAIFALWANLHGGFLYGLVLIGLYLAGDAMEVQWGHGRAIWIGRLRRHGLLLAGALAGTLLNPSGPGLLAHVVGYLGKGYLVDGTAEYQSPDFHALYGRIFLVVVLGLVAALAVGGRRPAFPRLAAMLVSLAFALISIRNIPLFGLVALPLLVLHLAGAAAAWRGSLLDRMRAGFAEAARSASFGGSSGATAGLLLAAAATRWGPGGRPLVQAGFDPAVFPVKAVARARAAGLSGPVFNEFAWGGYLLYAWPEQRVFIDGQTDFYGVELTREYVAIRGAEPGWRERMA